MLSTINKMSDGQDEDWVFWSQDGTLGSLYNRTDIRHYLKEAERRLRRRIYLRRNLSLDFEAAI